MFEIDVREEGPNQLEFDKSHAPFVGRRDIKVRIKEDIKKSDFQLFQVTGGAVVGKSRLAEEVSNELLQESLERNTKLKCVPLPLRNKTSECLELIKMKIMQEFGKKDYSQRGFDFLGDAKDTLKTSGAGIYFLIIMDDCDQMISDGSRTAFIGLVSTLVKSSSRIKVILTSREKFDFPRLYKSARHYPLSGLTDAESVELLTRSAPSVQFLPNEPLIIKHCSGLPLLLIILARTLEEHKPMISKEDFLEVLEKFPFESWKVNRLSDEDSIEKIMEKFVACLDQHLKESLSVLSYFPGSFSAEAAAAVIGESRVAEAKVFKILPLHKKSMMDFDSTNSRYSILPVIRQYMNGHEKHLQDTDTVRLRFCQFFSNILKTANTDLFEKPINSVISAIYDDWANIEQTLREASQPTTDLFAVNMKIVRNAPEVITALVPELAESYYRRCKTAAELFGTEFDVACINSCLGASLGYVKGNQLKHAFDILLEAENKIPTCSGFQRVKLLCHLEWNLYRQGRIEEAMRYQDLGLALEAVGDEGSRIQRLQVNLQNHKALSLVLLGRTDEALKLLHETIESTDKHHPALKVMLNSLGLVFSEQRDTETALKYFLASLTERRKSTGPDKRILVIPLVNVGNLLIRRNKHTLAMKLLDEAVEIRQKLEWIHLDTAVAVYNRGKILRKCGRYDEALSDLQEAYRIYKECVDTHWVLAGVRVEMAKCFELRGQLREAEHMLEEVLRDRIHLKQNKQLDICIHKAFDRLMNLTTDKIDKWESIAEEKCMYYQSLIQEENQPDLVDKYSEELQSLREKIKEKTDTETLIASPPRIAKSDVAVYKLLEVEGHPHNMERRVDDRKSQVKEKDLRILSRESRIETIADQGMERVDSNHDNILRSKTNDKILNLDGLVSCDGNMSNRISENESDFETANPSGLYYCVKEQLNHAPNSQMVHGSDFSHGCSIGEATKGLSNEHHCHIFDNINEKECVGALELDRSSSNWWEMYETISASSQHRDYLCTHGGNLLLGENEETDHNLNGPCPHGRSLLLGLNEETGDNLNGPYDGKTPAPNFRCGDFSGTTNKWENNGNVDEMICDLACHPVHSLQVKQPASDTSTLTGSSLTSTETVLHLSLDNKPN